MNTEIEVVGWAILQALHEGVEDGPQSWSDVAGDHEKRIKKAAIAAIEAVTDLSQYKGQGFSWPAVLCKRPVAFRIPRMDPETAGTTLSTSEWRYFTNEKQAYEESEIIGGAVQGLYVRDGEATVAEWQPIASAPTDGQFLVGSVDEDVMIVSGQILWMALKEDTPRHLSLKHMTHWMPLPVPPLAFSKDRPISDATYGVKIPSFKGPTLTKETP